MNRAAFPSSLTRRARAPRGCRCRSAFTLLELVVAMMMVAILAASLYATLRIAFDAKSSAEAALDPSRTADLVMAFMREDFENAILTNASSKLAPSFEGTSGGGSPDDLTFFTTADSPEHPSSNGEIKMVELSVYTPTGGDSQALMRKVSRNLLAQTITPDEEVLCRGVTNFSVRYCNGNGNWVDSWDSTQEDNTTPSCVEVTLEFDRPATTAGSKMRHFRYVRVFTIPSSTAATDPQVAAGGGL